MGGVRCGNTRAVRVVLCVVAAVIAFEARGASQGSVRFGEDANLTYIRGQSVEPVFHGWVPNDDGTFDLYFSYINRNWQEEPDIPIGPNNNITPVPLVPTKRVESIAVMQRVSIPAIPAAVQLSP